MASVFQNSVKSNGFAYATWYTWLADSVSPVFPPNSTHPSGDLRAKRLSTCFVSPACMWAWSIPIKRSTCPLPRRNFVFGKRKSSGMCEVLTVAISSLILGMPIALTVNLLELSSMEDNWTLYSFVFIVFSSPSTLVTDAFFLVKLRVSASSCLIKLICAPESRSTFPRLNRSSALPIFAERTGRIASLVSVAMTTPIVRALLLWSIGWWDCGHCFPFSDFMHCRFRLQLSIRCSPPAFFKQLKQTWFALAVFIRSSMLRASNFWHWSGHCVDTLHNQHLCRSSTALKWLIRGLGGGGGVLLWLRILDFISAVIEHINACNVAVLFSLSNSLAQTFLSSVHIFCSMIDNIWLLSISLGNPTSFKVL